MNFGLQEQQPCGTRSPPRKKGKRLLDQSSSLGLRPHRLPPSLFDNYQRQSNNNKNMPPMGTTLDYYGGGIGTKGHTHVPNQTSSSSNIITVDFESLTLDLSSYASPPNCCMNNEEEMKEWIWSNCKDKILEVMSFRNESEKSHTICENDITSSEGSLRSDQQLELLERVAYAQRKYLQSEGPMAVYSCLLEGLLDMMGSEFGFIGESRYNANGKMYLHIHVSTDISWDDTTRKFYEEHHKNGLDFYNLDNLFGYVLTSKTVVMANDAKRHPRATGLPPGHPDVRKFLGVPILAQSGELLGMFAIANKPSGYNESDIKFLEPFTDTCANVIQSYNSMTQNKRLIQNLQASNKELEEANRRVVSASQLQLRHFACMSHEIRTPLNCIIGMPSLLRKDSDLTPMQEQSMRMVEASGEVLAAVVNDVLDYSKLESGSVDFDIAKRSLQDTLNTVTTAISSKASEKNVSLTTVYDPRVPEYIKTDHRRLEQILFNLLGNSIKFSKEGGTIELHVLIADGADHVCNGYKYGSSGGSSESESTYDWSCETTSPPLPMLRFIVKDYGKGIASDEFEKVFEPFSQTADETKRVNGGTGLGLAITTKLVTGLGGDISVDSRLGEWSCFTVNLPLHERPLDTSEGSKELSDTTILIISQNAEPSGPVSSKIAEYLQAYNLNTVSLSSMEQLQDVLPQNDPPVASDDRKYVCLVYEGCYNSDLYLGFSRKVKCSLLTFGPKFTVQETAKPIGCPLKYLPSTLLRMVQERASVINGPSGSPSKRQSLVRTGSTSNQQTFQSLKILVVEDNKINQKVMSNMLKRLKIGCFEIANNGLEAVEMESRTEYDLILMDVEMPVMNGIEACKKILAREGGHTRPPVVFVTAHAMHAHQTECSKAGGVAFLPKPFKIDKISEVIHSFCKGVS